VGVRKFVNSVAVFFLSISCFAESGCEAPSSNPLTLYSRVLDTFFNSNYSCDREGLQVEIRTRADRLYQSEASSDVDFRKSLSTDDLLKDLGNDYALEPPREKAQADFQSVSANRDGRDEALIQTVGGFETKSGAESQ